MTRSFKNVLIALSMIVPSTGFAAGDCSAVAELAPDGMTITGTQSLAPTDELPVAHCLVHGRIGERNGADGNDQRSAESFECLARTGKGIQR